LKDKVAKYIIALCLNSLNESWHEQNKTQKQNIHCATSIQKQVEWLVVFLNTEKKEINVVRASETYSPKIRRASMSRSREPENIIKPSWLLKFWSTYIQTRT